MANTAAAPASRGYIAASSSVKGEGGATYLSSAGTIRVEQSTFDSNRGKSGGALAAIASTTLELRRASVRNNSAEVNGGGAKLLKGSCRGAEDRFARRRLGDGRRIDLSAHELSPHARPSLGLGLFLGRLARCLWILAGFSVALTTLAPGGCQADAIIFDSLIRPSRPVGLLALPSEIGAGP